MSNVNDVELVKNLIISEDEESEEFIYELTCYRAGSKVDFEYAELPENWNITIKEVNDERLYDSYGNGYTEDAYIILSVSDGVETVLYKLPGEYASFRGWTWEADKLKKVESVTKTINVWEEI